MKTLVDNIVAEIGSVILGKEAQIKSALACLLAGGHLLIEDIPGVGKTTLGHVLASTLGLNFQRIQFTSDLLPADILGSSIYDRQSNGFHFHPGPIFSQLILADEINRATPKTQSALLEAMEEFQVTVEGETRALPRPFFVIATQNPSESVGTFPLPESQLDRFLMRIQLGYPDERAEREILQGRSGRRHMDSIKCCIAADQLQDLIGKINDVHTSSALVDYVQAIVRYSRQASMFHIGLSPRAAIAMMSAIKAWAYINDRDHVIPEDVQAMLPLVVDHRVKISDNGHGQNGAPASSLILNNVAIP